MYGPLDDIYLKLYVIYLLKMILQMDGSHEGLGGGGGGGEGLRQFVLFTSHLGAIASHD